MSSSSVVSLSDATSGDSSDSLFTVDDGVLDSAAQSFTVASANQEACAGHLCLDEDGRQGGRKSRVTLDDVPEGYHRWRPTSHIMAARGWMNDPCAPGYNPVTGYYHVNFQWNPSGHTWGNMSWGYAASPDLINWVVSRLPSMTPTPTQDQCGVFTGALQPSNGRSPRASDEQPHSLTAFYTSAQKLPINHRLPYTRGSEKIAVATSADGGLTWQRRPYNIVAEAPPAEYDVVGWRDPFVGTWDSLDKLLGLPGGGGHQYGIVSGGLRGKTPTVFLYLIGLDPADGWEFISPIINLGLNYRASRWTGGDFGTNWEVTNFLTLSDGEGEAHELLITSAEGVQEDAGSGGGGGDLSKDHRQMWMCGTLERGEADGVEMRYRFGGALDHGSFYAANGFWDPLTDQFLTFGWVFEEDLPEELVARQGWSGCLSMPRVVSLKSWRAVVGATRTKLSDISSFSSKPEADGTFSVTTLSLTPDARSRNARLYPALEESRPFEDGINTCSPPLARLELILDLQAREGSQTIGFDILHSADHSQYTRVYFHARSETLLVDRSHSASAGAGIKVGTRSAPHTLFTFQDGTSTRREYLKFHVFYDKSVLEIFVNERVAITTRVYPEDSRCHGIRLYAPAADDGPGASTSGSLSCDATRKKQNVASLVTRYELWQVRGTTKYCG